MNCYLQKHTDISIYIFYILFNSRQVQNSQITTIQQVRQKLSTKCDWILEYLFLFLFQLNLKSKLDFQVTLWVNTLVSPMRT